MQSLTAPRARIRSAGVPIGLRCDERRLLPRPIRLLRPSPDHPLRPIEQRRQRPREFGEIALVCYWFAVARHGTLREMAGLEGLDFQARRSVPLLEPDFIVEIVGEARLLRRLRLTKLIKLLLR